MYYWKSTLPSEQQKYFTADWMNANILQNHGALCALYKAHTKGDNGFAEGDFRSEGDSPAYFHTIGTGLRNMESPDWGGWGGRYVNIRENTWLDPVLVPNYTYPEGRWYGDSAWGRERLRATIPNDSILLDYLKPIWRWADALQNDFAARADWCKKSYKEANHPPIVVLKNQLDMEAKPGAIVKLSARGTSDPDGNKLSYKWWQYREAGSLDGKIDIMNEDKQDASFIVPAEAKEGKTIHVILSVTDKGTPAISRYKRVIVTVLKN